MTTTLAREPVAAPEPERQGPPSLELASYGDLLFRGLLTLAAAAIPVLLGFLVFELWVGSRLAIAKFGLDFVTTSTWDPVAEQLVISPKTVGRHVENLYAKIGVSSRAAAAVFAMEQGLLE